MDELLSDLRYTIRTLIKAPAFTLAAVAALTLGIGANTAIFSVVNAVLLKPIAAPDPDRIVPHFSVVNAVLLKPVAAPDPDRVVSFMNTSPQGSGPAASPAKFMHWRRQSDVVQDVSAYRSTIVTYTGGDVPEQLRAGQVSADFFRLFGAADAPRAHLHGGGGLAERRQDGGARSRPLDPPFRQRSQNTRPVDRARRRAVHRRRRPAPGFDVELFGGERRAVHSVSDRSEHERPGPLLRRRQDG